MWIRNDAPLNLRSEQTTFEHQALKGRVEMVMRIVRRLTLVVLLCAPLLRAQTVISVPVASGAGVKYVMPERFGINLDDSYNYGNNQLTANLLASDGVSFTPQIWQGASQCSYSGASTWVDANGYSPQIGNFWSGASYQVISGPNIGKTGTITDSRPATGAQGQTYTLSGTLSSACIGGGNSDEMILRCRTPLSTCATGYSPSNLAGINLTTQAGGTNTFETTDVSPSSNSPQAMQLTAPGTAEAGIQAIYEGLLTYHSYININGTYTLTFRAKATSGAPTMYYYVYRTGGQQFLTGSVTPTVNPTPGAGWQNYSFTFTASENGGQVEDGSVWLDATGGTVLLQDIALTEQPTGGNTTVFRNAVYQHLLALHPGILRMMTADSWGCTVDNMMVPTYSGRYLCGDNSYQNIGQPISYGWSDFMTLAHAVGADPWITFSVYSTPTDMTNVAAYMSGTCGNGNPYTAMRCNYGQITPWTQVFNHIYLEMGNEIWNSPNGEDVYGNGGQNYGVLLAANIVSLKSSPFYSSNLKMVGSGFELQSNFAYGWNWTVLTAAGSNLPDYIDGAPYMFQDMTDLSSNQNIFGPMFAEPVNYVLPSGPTSGLQQYTQANFPGVNGAVYETNLTTNCALTGTTQTQINQVVAGVGAGLDATMAMLLGVRDAGVLVQSFFALPEVENSFGLAASGNSGSCPQTYSPWEPLWGSNLFMPGPTDSSSIDRPSGISLQLINKAMDNKLNVLNTVQTGTPTYNQPAAQPNPTSWPTAGLNSIAANAAVPYVQAFGFGDGAGNYSLIVYNVNLNANEAISFSGPGAPSGTVTKTVFTSNNITDNNEGLAIGKTPVVGYPTSTTVSNPTGDSLPPFSMTTYTWSTGATAGPAISVASSLNPSIYGQPVTFTATLTGTSSAPTGTVTFINGTTSIGTAALTVTGGLTSTATFTTSALPAGTDAITVSYASSSSPVFNQSVSISSPTTAAVTSSQSPTGYGQSTTLTATLSGLYAAPTGPVVFMNGATAIATANLIAGSGLSSTAALTTSILPVGTDAITAVYATTTNFSAVTSPAFSQVVNTAGTTTVVASSLSPSSYGQSVTLTATVSGTFAAPSGSVTFMNGPASLGNATLTPGGSLSSTATLAVSTLPVGTNSITAVFAATANFGASTSSALSQAVNAAGTTAAVSSSLSPASAGQSVTLTATLTSGNAAPTGSVVFMDGVTSLGNATLTPGSGLSSTATINTTTLPVGTDSITVVYAATANFGASTSPAFNQVVNSPGSTATVASSLNPSNSGQSVTFTATISSTTGAPTGSVVFMNGATSLGSVALTPGGGLNSTATLATSSLPVGTSSITAVYAGNGSFGAVTSSALSQVVNGASTTATVASSLNPANAGQSVTFTATVSSTTAAPTGSIVFMDGATSLGSVALTPGGGLSSTATLAASSLPVGTDSITVVYAGNGSFGATTSSALGQVVNGASTTATVASSLNPANAGQSVTFTATVSSSSAAPTGSVVFMNGATSLGSAVLIAGGGLSSTATLTTSTLPSGTDSITVVYAATGNFGASTSAALSEVVNAGSTTASVASSLSPSGYGQSVTFTATVSSGSAAPTGSVTFMNGATAIGTATLAAGSGGSSTATLTTAALPVGSDSITVVYAGSGSFGAATSSALTQVVNGAITTASVTSAVSPASFAQGVSFTASVSSSGAAPTGSVTFMNGATTLGSATLTPGGASTSTATLTSATLPVGTNSITVVYAGTGNIAGSTSPAFPQIINPAFINNAGMVSSQSPSSFNQPVTFTATLSTLYVAPTGVVVFMDGLIPLGSVTLTPGGGFSSTASLTTAALALGTHSITAAYAATTNFGPVTTGVLSQLVNAAASTTATVTSSVNPAGSGQSVTLTGTLVGVTTAPTGSVVFMDGATAIGTVTLTAAGGLTSTATLTASTLPLGTDPITVVYAGNGSSGAATSAVFNQIVNPPASTASVTPSLNPASVGQGVSFTATVSSSNAAPTGSVTFMDGGTVIGSATLSSGGGLSSTATLTTATLPGGTDSITVVYAGSANFGGAISPALNEIVNAASTTATVASSGSTSIYGQSVNLTATVSSGFTAPTGSVVFLDGTTTIGTATLAASGGVSGVATLSISSLPVGTDPITVVYAATQNFGGSTSGVLSQVVNIASTTATVTVLTDSPNSTSAGQSVTLTAVVTGSSIPPTGTVTFYSGQTALGTGTVNASGHATYSTSSLAVGTDTLSAVYSGDTTYSASTSAGISETVQALQQDFGVALPSQSFTVATQNSLTTSVTLSSQNGFADTVNLSCGSLPTFVTCSLSPSTTNLASNGTTSSVLTIGTGSAQAYLLHDSDPLHPARSPFNLALMLCPMGLLAGIAAFPNRKSKRNPRLRLLILLLSAIPMAAAISGCSTPSIVHELTSTAAGTYTIPITATGANSRTNHTIQLTLTVTQ
jgi:hypothetical protein